MSVAIVGMLDEREEALRLIKETIEKRGHKPLLLDISVGNGGIVPSLQADVSCGELVRLAKEDAEASGQSISGDATATSIMAKGLTLKVSSLHQAGEIEGIIAITGMTGALITLDAMKMLPFGVPKLLISSAVGMPAHAGQLSKYFAVKDITVMHAVVDTVGMNPLVQTLAVNGANAVCGMLEGDRISQQGKRPSLAITEFGFCDKGAHYIREILERDFEIVSFHATGFGDMAAMDLVPQGVFKAFIDLVPGAFSEYLLGGNRGGPGPGRLDIALNVPIPYVLCPGGFDMISCGPLERKDKDPLWISRKLAERKLHIQDPPRVQARMSAEEAECVGTAAAERLNRYVPKARVKVVIPLRGFSNLSSEGAPLHDPAADRAFAVALKRRLDPSIEVIEVDSDINSRQFARAVSDALGRALKV